MKVSVIVPYFNEEKYIRKNVESLLSQSYPSDLCQIILINDGSTDNTPLILGEYKFPDHFEVIHHKTNLSCAAARNSGLSRARGEIIIFLGGDVEVPSNYVQSHVKIHKHPEIAGVVGRLLPSPNIKMDKFQKFLYYGKRGAARFGSMNNIPFETFLLSNSSVKADVIRSAGIIDENLSSYGGSELEFAYRLYKTTNKRFVFSENIFAIHHGQRTFEQSLTANYEYGKNNLAKLYEINPNLVTIATKNFNKGWRKTLGAIFLNRWIKFFINWLYRISPYPISNLWIRTLLLESLLRGYRQSQAHI